ncbi:MAG: hypothetical protein HQ472_10905 [Ignavibacteria bacterium]|nr:hypothetical protein [Ignavibacteria bacterium]
MDLIKRHLKQSAIFFAVIFTLISCTTNVVAPDGALITYSPKVGDQSVYATYSEVTGAELYKDTVTVTSVRTSGDTVFYVTSRSAKTSLDGADLVLCRGRAGYLMLLLQSYSKSVYWQVDVGAEEGMPIDSMDLTRTSVSGEVIGYARYRVECGRKSVPIAVGATTHDTREMHEMLYDLDSSRAIIPTTRQGWSTTYYSPSKGVIRIEHHLIQKYTQLLSN